mmetsp:Transcript_16569/g.47239  ORF Transcript_16569/g.47239 Transcript_16569/m.47239 type:complete len:250 (-) Transcript_16569:5936-6685(-)
MEMSQEARRSPITPPTRRPHGAGHDRVDDADPGLLLQIVVAAAVDELPQQFNRRLGAVGLDLGHVHVVHKDDSHGSHGRAEHALPPLPEVAVDNILGHVGTRLGREAELDRFIFRLVEVGRDAFHDGDGFTRTRGAANQRSETVRYQGLAHVRQLRRVPGRHHDRRKLRVLGDRELLERVDPVDPRALPRVVAPVLQVTRVRRRALDRTLELRSVLIGRLDPLPHGQRRRDALVLFVDHVDVFHHFAHE